MSREVVVRRALFTAVAKNNVKAVKICLGLGVSIDAVNDGAYKDAGQYLTPLMFACTSKGSLDMVRSLIKVGANVNYMSSGITALGLAAGQDSIECARELLEAGADVCQRGGFNVLELACDSSGVETVKLLLDWGAAVNPHDDDFKSDGTVDGLGSVLHHAAHRGRSDIVRLLLARGANYKLALDTSGVTQFPVLMSPLCLAKRYRQDEVVDTMLEFGPLKRSLDRRTCSYCGQTERKLFEPPLQICRCCRTRYCSRTCQKFAWQQGHQKICAEILTEFQGLYALAPWQEPTAVEFENHLTVLRDIRNKYKEREPRLQLRRKEPARRTKPPVVAKPEE